MRSTLRGVGADARWQDRRLWPRARPGPSLPELSSAEMTQGDGNGWVGCDQDHRHWGKHGAAGLLIWAPDSSGRPLVLLIRRAGWSHHGGTWGPPGGARDSHESPAEAAVREAAEECGAPPRGGRDRGPAPRRQWRLGLQAPVGGAGGAVPGRAGPGA